MNKNNKTKRKNIANLLLCTAFWFLLAACEPSGKSEQAGRPLVPDMGDATVWTFWHWVHGAVSKEGIKADLQAMKAQGIGGAYVFSIRDTIGLYEHQVLTQSAQWWDIVKYTVAEAKRIGVELGFNTCDGFTTAGGPWINPEQSMQKVVWTDTIVEGGRELFVTLPKPEDYKGYYEDIATFAFPVSAFEQDSWSIQPKVTSNMKDGDLQFLAKKNNKKTFTSKQEGWIEYAFDEPFTCQTIQISTGWANYQSNRLIIQFSDDGQYFKTHAQLLAPRSGWQDLYQPNTQSIQPVTAKFFRFVFDKKGSEPGAEDLDDAKWIPKLQLKGLRLLSSARIHQFEGKNGSIWRIAKEAKEYHGDRFVEMEKLIDVSKYVANGTINWTVPSGKWKIIRIGHTSTGRENYIGGGARGLECDKFNEEAVRLQFDKWYGEIFKQVGAGLAQNTITRLLCDSWECGSQNWTAKFPTEFETRRGYALMPYLPLMAGIPIENAEVSERVLRDVRETIAELFAEKFSGTMAAEAHKLGVRFVGESNAPTGVVDGMLHQKYVDYPMGEFWFQSPSHDKPNDILDAVSAAHIYGKPVVQSESFTQIRLDWNETPAMLKTYADRNLALGINKIVNHVFVHNPWLDRKPGVTLDKIGTFLQRDQTWWDMSSGFWNYLENAQRLLQEGTPVVDIAVFTGEEIPRRAILPDRLINTLPGLFGTERLLSEKKRLLNEGFPTYEMPHKVSTQANMVRPEHWLDPLRGYTYDSFNKDVLLNLSYVENGKIRLPSGMCYSILVIPGNRKMAPHGGERMSIAVAEKLLQLLNDGASILMQQKPEKTISLNENDDRLLAIIDEMFSGYEKNIELGGEKLTYIQKGKGRLIYGAYKNTTLKPIGLQPDFTSDASGELAWNHRRNGSKEIYFIANQNDKKLTANLSFRQSGKIPAFYDALTGAALHCRQWENVNGRINLSYEFPGKGSVFVIFDKNNADVRNGLPNNFIFRPIKKIQTPWTVTFNCGQTQKTLAMQHLQDWTSNEDEQIRYYSGIASYLNAFDWNKNDDEIWLDLGDLSDVAQVSLNDRVIGVVWTKPYRLRIDKYLRQGSNRLKVEVANTWNNRLIGDHALPEEKRTTWTTAPYRLEGQPLLKAGLLGQVTIGKMI